MGSMGSMGSVGSMCSMGSTGVWWYGGTDSSQSDG